jgi:large subunit ribosomal protein L7A
MKALQKHEVSLLFVAEDAQSKHVKPLIAMAEAQQIPIEFVSTMKELGKACEVEVKTATAALLVNEPSAVKA